MTATYTETEPCLDFVRSRRHARIIPATVSDLFSRCIQDAYTQQVTPTDDTIYLLARYYGVTPNKMRDLIAELAAEHTTLRQVAS